jgi:hypothetical protein
MKMPQDFAGRLFPKLRLGETSTSTFEFWFGGCAGGVPGAAAGLWFGDRIHRISVVHLGWITDVHTQSNPQLYSVDIDTILPFNNPSSRLYSGSQDINPMTHVTNSAPVPSGGGEYRPPGPNLGRHGSRPLQAPPTGLKPVPRPPLTRCTPCNQFPRRNSDSRQDFYATLRTP